MGLKVGNKWVWDFWFAQDGPDYHIFYLQAPNSLAHERERHFNVSIGHAVSQDLINWNILADALAPSNQIGAWDNFTTWTGSIIQHDGLWYMFYTGTNRAEKGLIQRIGLATSRDLIVWEKHTASPLIVTDPKWYELLDQELWHDQAWRDPWIFEYRNQFHAFITGRVNHGPGDGRGVIAHAVSDDLIKWEARPPVSETDEFGHLEVPQLVEIEGRWYVIFCVNKEAHSISRLKRGVKPETGIHYLVGDNPLGPFKQITDDFLLGDEFGMHYSGKVLQDPQGDWVLITSLSWTSDGGFIGEIADPILLDIAPNGVLRCGEKPE